MPLDPGKKTRIGRGTECTLMLNDALCSRVHAVIFYDHEVWRVHDAQSRNGTFVNGQKIERAALGDGHRLRVGSTEFVFHESEQPPTLGPLAGPKITQTLIKDTRVGQPSGDSVAVAAIGDSESSQELLLLHQLCLRAMGSHDLIELMRVSLEVLRERTGASTVGFLERGDDGKLSPKLVLPETLSAPIVLSESLTRLVCDAGHAVWIANQHAAPEDVRHHADALCVPLVDPRMSEADGPAALAALYVYLEQGRFRQSHFDFAISVANVAVLMLVRLRGEQRLKTELERLGSQASGQPQPPTHPQPPSQPPLHGRPAAGDSLRLDEWEQHLIREALARAGGHVPEAARLLGLGRATLYRKLEEYGIGR